MKTQELRWRLRKARAWITMLGFGVLLGGTPVMATQITLEQATQSVAPGDSVELAVRIAGLGNGTAPSLGAFDLDLVFDPAIVTYSGIVFGDPLLGDLLGPIVGSVGGSAVDAAAGTLNLFAVSLDAAGDLDAMQPEEFTLASIRFDAIGLGRSTIEFANVVLGDANGTGLVPDLVRGATIRVSQGVPDDGMVASGAFLVGFTAWCMRWRRTQEANRENIR